jgi:predicted nucleic acid-binding protein
LVNNFQVIYVDEELLKQSMEIYLKYDGTLSVAGAVSLEIMRRRGIKKIVSFGADLDKVAGIARVH